MKRAVMYGAGNIGRGFIAQLFSQSGYEVIFIDINELVIDALNSDKKYRITTVSNDDEKKIIIDRVSGINPKIDEDKAVQAIAECDIMATAVGANIIKHIVPVIAKGLLLRHKISNNSLNILLCENLMDVQVYIKNLLLTELGSNQAYILEKTGFVKTSIGRMVPVVTNNTYPTDVTVEEFDILHVDKNGFVGDIPNIKNMIAYAPFEVYVQRKLFMHNMGHAITAYLGAIKGYSYIHEAINDIEIKYCVYACGIEAAHAISKEGYPLNLLIDFYDRLIYRFNNKALKDTVLRVGRDVKRKLAPNDRITGAIQLCKKQDTPYAFLLLGIAGALLFNQEEDLTSKIIYDEAKSNIQETIRKYTKITSHKDLEDIEKLYKMLECKDIQAAIRFCEKRKAMEVNIKI